MHYPGTNRHGDHDMEGCDPMKKTLLKILAFALVLALLLGVSAIVERLQPSQEETAQAAPEPTPAADIPLWERVPDAQGATAIALKGDHAAIQGAGAAASAGGVTIAYPGTYILSGSLDDGCVTIDCEIDGEVYLILDNASIHCSTGPAIYVRQSLGTLIYLADGSENALSDGGAYATVVGADGQAELKQPDAALYSADDLALSGTGALTITGSYDTAIHSRDAIYLVGGDINATAVLDGVKAADGIGISGSMLALTCGDDGISSSKGYVSMASGSVSVDCKGDAVSALLGAEVSGGDVTVTDCREGMDAPVIVLSGGTVSIAAEDSAIAATMGDIDSGVTAADCSVTICGGSLYAIAPCCVRSDGAFTMTAGAAFLRALSAEDTPLKAADSTVSGGAMFLCGDFESTILSRDGGLNAVYYRSESAVAAGQTVSLANAAGETVFALTPNTEFYSLLIAYAGLVQGDSYTLSCGSSVPFTQSEWLTTAVAQRWGGFGGRGSGGGPGGFRP